MSHPQTHALKSLRHTSSSLRFSRLGLSVRLPLGGWLRLRMDLWRCERQRNRLYRGRMIMCELDDETGEEVRSLETIGVGTDQQIDPCR
jgi:hypothetical protein